MFQEEYIRDLGSNYLVLNCAGEAYDEFQVQMLLNNRIAGLLECEIRIIDNHEKFLYEISSKQPLSRIYEKAEMDYDALVSILRGIAKAVKSAKEYLLDTGHFILQPEYMYINPETRKISLCFFPLYYVGPDQAFHELAEYILDKVDYKEERAVVLAYDFYRKAKEDNFNINSVLRVPVPIGGVSVPRVEPPRQEEHRKKDILPEQKTEVRPKKKVEEKVLFTVGITILALLIIMLLLIQIYQPVFLIASRKMQQITLIVAAGMGGTVAFISFVTANRIYCRKNKEKVIQAEDEIRRRYHAEEAIQKEMTREAPYCGDTVLLVRSNQKAKPKLIHMKNGKLQEILIQGDPFVIGKMSRGVDAVIKERSISRMHAKISEKEGNYYLTDLNSTNGTYKNGVRLTANETTPLKQDDEIKLADLTFYFACC